MIGKTRLIRSIRFLLFILPPILFAANCQANDYQGLVSNIFAYSGQVYIYLGSGAFGGGGPGSCPAANSQMIYSVDPSTAYGRALLSMAITAKATTRQVYVQGNGACAMGPGQNAEAMSAMNLE